MTFIASTNGAKTSANHGITFTADHVTCRQWYSRSLVPLQLTHQLYHSKDAVGDSVKKLEMHNLSVWSGRQPFTLHI